MSKDGGGYRPRRPMNYLEVEALARAYTKTAIKTIAGIMMETTTAPAVRVKAAEVLLERGWGKPQGQTQDMQLEDSSIDRIVREIVYMPPTPGETVMEITTPDDDTVIIPWTRGNGGGGGGNGGDVH